LPKTLRVTHRFCDAFTLIAPANSNADDDLPMKAKGRMDWLKRQNWLLIHEDTNTGQQLRAWLRRQGWSVAPTMQLDNYDIIINLVALGMGVSLVPIRSLALYGQKRSLRRWPLPVRFERELVVAARKHRKMPSHLSRFIENVLF
jgi:DNA-binding transcriptional LysR family regulator